jgi:hypothetical protein
LIDRERLLPNPAEHLEVSVRTLPDGSEILTADGFLRDPHYVRSLALSLDYAPSQTLFPGGRAVVPISIEATHRTIVSELCEMPEHSATIPHGPYAYHVFFAATTPDLELTPLQRVPHVDGVDCLAALIYLNLPGQCRGGTGFYRHRPTGWVTFPAERFETGDAMRSWFLESAEDAPGSFITESRGPWELLELVEMKFNRLVLYHSQTFHSGYIRADDWGLTLAERRLTQNLFIQLADADPEQPHGPSIPILASADV